LAAPLLHHDPGAQQPATGFFARYIEVANQKAGQLLLIAGLLALGAFSLATRLELHTDMAELLPSNHPAVVALRRIEGKQKSSTNLVVLVHSKDEAANIRFAEALRPRLESMVGSLFTEVQWHPDPEIPAFAARNWWLYASEPDLSRASSLIDRVIARRTSPLAIDLTDEDPEAELRELRRSYDERRPKPISGPYFLGAQGEIRYLGIMLWRHGDGLASVGDYQTLDAVKTVVSQVDPKKFAPDLAVEYTGGIAMAIDEHDAIRDDLTIATLLCTTLVLFAIWLYFRRFAVLLAVGAPAVLGLLLALALARVTVQYLNANTAFLISIILGNGINSPIILLARYGEERRAGKAVPEALLHAMHSSVLATGTAMAAASIAYGSLLLTSFRGFSQFGLVGGAGMLLVWVMMYFLIPPLVIVGERIRPGLFTPRANIARAPFAALGALAQTRPWALASISLALIAICAMPVFRYLRDPLEWNFQNLRSKETRSQQNWATMYRLGMGDVGAGQIATDGVLLVDSPAQAEPVAQALRDQDARKGKDHILKEVRTLSSVLPQDQESKLALLSRIRKQIDRALRTTSPEERDLLARLRPPETLRKLAVSDLPEKVRDMFTELSGERGRLVGIDATNFSDWNGHDLLRLAAGMRVEALGRTWVAASTSTVFAGMLEAMVRDGPEVTLAALALVSLLVLFAFGWRGAVPVLLSLATGLLWLFGLLALLGLKLNFVNFIGVPITLGVGADYAANVWARVRADPKADLKTVLGDTGSAVALCSATTIIGYGSLLLASNRALQSFGKLAMMGEITCLVASLIALPSMIQLLRRRGLG
jgi:predicted RND superfamily exporter protein